MSKNIRIIFLRTLQLRAHAKKQRRLKGLLLPRGTASQHRGFTTGVAASQRRRRRSVGGSPGASQRRSVGGIAASGVRWFGGVAASGVRRERRSVGGVAASGRRRRRSIGSLLGVSQRRRSRSTIGSPGVSQRRASDASQRRGFAGSVAAAQRRPSPAGPFSPCADLSPIHYILCFPFVLHLKCPFLEDPLALFEQLDADGGGELSLQERNAFRFCLPNCWNDRGLWQELDEDAGLILHHFQEYTVAKYKRGVEDYAGMAGMVGLGS